MPARRQRSMPDPSRSPRVHRALPVLVAALAMTLLVLLPVIGTQTHSVQAQRDRKESPCKLKLGKFADPTLMWLGEWTTLTLTSTTSCPAQKIPLNIVLSIDASLSMNPQNKLTNAQKAARRFVDEVDFKISKVGVTSFSDKGYVESELTDSRGRVVSAINGLDTEFGTDIEGGLRESQNLFVRSRTRNRDPELPEPIEVLVILSDGRPYPADRHGRQVAGRLKGDGVIIFSICVGNDCDVGLMRGFASQPSFYFNVTNSNGLVSAFQRISDRLQQAELKQLIVTDELPANMKYIDGSAEPEPFNIDGQTLSWLYNVIPKTGVTITYDVEPLEAGIWPTNVEASLEFRDTENRIGNGIFPVPIVEVLEPPTPTPTNTATDTPTSTPTNTPGPTPTNTPTNTPTPTNTNTPRPLRDLYLPILLRESCKPKIESADVVLVIDVSSSMNYPTRDGGMLKHVAARRAAQTFVKRLRRGHDQVSVVVFAETAEVLAPLGGDLDQALAAIERIPRREGTRIDAGLRAASAQLKGPARREQNTAAILLVTDGQPTRGDIQDLRQAAKEARDNGVHLFSIGLGNDVNPALLRELAGDDARFFEAPEAEDLEGIYDRIASYAPCPKERHDWGEP